MSQILQSETGMLESRLLSFEDCPNGLHVLVRWKELGEEEDTVVPTARVYENVPRLFQKLLRRKSKPIDLITRVRADLNL